jgi:hypothetical protein
MLLQTVNGVVVLQEFPFRKHGVDFGVADGMDQYGDFALNVLGIR